MEKIKRKIKNNKGITLIALVITVVVMAIISSVAIISGLDTADDLDIKKFNDELKIIQARVDILYEQIKLGEKEEKNFGGHSYEEMKGVMERTFNNLNDKTITKEDYWYYTKQNLKKYLAIDDVNQSVLINWKTRDIISVEGIKIDGVRYYRYEGVYKPTYEEEAKNISIIPTIETNGDIRKVTVLARDEDDGEISNFTLKYKLREEDTWKIADYNYFETTTESIYNIQVSGNGIITSEEVVDTRENLFDRLTIKGTDFTKIENGYSVDNYACGARNIITKIFRSNRIKRRRYYYYKL